MKVKTFFVPVFRCFAALLLIAFILCFMAWAVRPNLTDQPPFQYTPEEIHQAAEARTIRIDPENPVVLYREVDYAQGESAPWWPKHESPVLAALVAEGKLPPVAERVGPEPIVLEGVEGLGQYGGIWFRIGGSSGDIFAVMGSRLGHTGLVRWSPQGYPIVPHMAKSWEASEDYREYIFHLRKGMKWSDGEPFTANDLLYWWEKECLNKELYGVPFPIMQIQGQLGNLEKIDDYTVKFTFPIPNGLFLAKLAAGQGNMMLGSPEHYLRKFHPDLGDPKFLDQCRESGNYPSNIAMYRDIIDKTRPNPELPSLASWICRTYRANPPYLFVRNPYYCMVDPQGHQLPYIDQIHYGEKSSDMTIIAAINGDLSFQYRGIPYSSYTLLMEEQKRSKEYEVFHWSHGSGSPITIFPNLNLKVDPNNPETKWKAQLLNDKRFRQALSLAIDRQAIIDTVYHGQSVPCQTGPGPESPFYNEKLFHAYTDYDPQRANEMLDDLGLAQRDSEGYRTFPDGSRMTFYMNYSDNTPHGPMQFVVKDWGEVGVRTIQRHRNRKLYDTERLALKHDFSVWGSDGLVIPALAPTPFVPVFYNSSYALAFGKWYSRGGLHDLPESKVAGSLAPPLDHPLRKAMELYDQVVSTGDVEEHKRLFEQIYDITAENLWHISIASTGPTIGVKSKNLHNVPKNAVEAWDLLSPANAGIETFYFDPLKPLPAGAIEEMRRSILEITPRPNSQTTTGQASREKSGILVTRLIRYSFLGILILFLLLIAFRYPYIGRRLLIMVPTLAIISVIVFSIIQLPPGDYLTSRIMQLQEQGDQADLKMIEELRSQFYLDKPVVEQYARWMGLYWFLPQKISMDAGTHGPKTEKWTIFRPEDTGLLQGNLGRSMEDSQPVNQKVGDRILLTVMLAFGAVLFTWAVAVPIGIYSAVRQYSVGDYVATFIGFVGMCVPPFLMAILVMFFSKKYLGIEVSGLFSPQYAAQPNWDWAKVINLLSHIWVPIIILGISGTAGMIRVMRANLLDELKKPYVVTARAKGVRPAKLLLKYPVRLALNPFISGIGDLFPMLVSGNAIVAIVLSLPTVGPLMLYALLNEDLFLAGSMLMVLSLLGIFGTLVSDLLLLWLDPRIRFQGGQK